jgi:hypothetical protein
MPKSYAEQDPYEKVRNSRATLSARGRTSDPEKEFWRTQVCLPLFRVARDRAREAQVQPELLIDWCKQIEQQAKEARTSGVAPYDFVLRYGQEAADSFAQTQQVNENKQRIRRETAEQEAASALPPAPAAPIGGPTQAEVPSAPSGGPGSSEFAAAARGRQSAFGPDGRHLPPLGRDLGTLRPVGGLSAAFGPTGRNLPVPHGYDLPTAAAAYPPAATYPGQRPGQSPSSPKPGPRRG